MHISDSQHPSQSKPDHDRHLEHAPSLPVGDSGEQASASSGHGAVSDTNYRGAAAPHRTASPYPIASHTRVRRPRSARAREILDVTTTIGAIACAHYSRLTR
jgi:hypothetical protein